MKFYISGRTAKVEEIKAMSKALEQRGHFVSFDWMSEDTDIPRPYETSLVENIAKKEIAGIRAADIFIIIGDEAGTGMYVELGIALATKKLVYSIGDFNDITVFHHLPNVKRLASFEDVLADLEK